MTSRASRIVTLAAALLIAACGGGGSSSSGTTGPFAASAAMRHLLAPGGTWTMTGTSNGQAFTVMIAIVDRGPGAFPFDGTASTQARQLLTISSGSTSNSAAETIYYNAASGAFIGFQSGNDCSAVTSNTAIPASTLVGTSGALYAETDYTGCSSAAVAGGTSTSTWSLEADGGVALLCWNLVSRDLGGAQTGAESTCVETAADGTLGSRARFTLSSGGLVVNARNF